MHMKIAVDDGLDRAVPLFGLNAPDKAGILMVSSRDTSDTTLVGVLPWAPEGDLQSDQSILTHQEPSGFAVALATLGPGGGFVFDGMLLQDVQYLYIQGGTYVDPSTDRDITIEGNDSQTVPETYKFFIVEGVEYSLISGEEVTNYISDTYPQITVTYDTSEGTRTLSNSSSSAFEGIAHEGPQPISAVIDVSFIPNRVPVRSV